MYAITHSCARLRAPEAVPNPCLKVMTFNLDVDAADLESALRTIEQADPDVVCVQEASQRWEQALRQRLGWRYRGMAFIRPADNQYGGAGILSRFAIHDHREIPKAPGGWFPSQIATIDSPLGPVQILNFHLRPPATDSGNKVIGVISARWPRKREIRQILTELKPDLPAIAMGDFNEGDDGSAVEIVRERKFTDCLSQFDRHTQTWRLQTGLIRLAERADHILHSPELHCTEAKVLPETSSDHDPVMAVIGLRR